MFAFFQRIFRTNAALWRLVNDEIFRYFPALLSKIFTQFAVGGGTSVFKPQWCQNFNRLGFYFFLAILTAKLRSMEQREYIDGYTV